MPHDRALSETISIILILLLVLVLAIVAAALFLGQIHLEQKTAYIAANISSQTLSGKNILTVFHRAGDEADLNWTGKALYTLGVYVDTSAGSNRTLPMTPGMVFKPGTTLYVFNTTSGYRVTTNSADLAAATALSVTACPVRLRIVDETNPGSSVLITKMDYPCTPTGPAPTVTSMNVTSGYRGWPIARSIVGTNFLPGAKAKFNLTAGIPTEIAATSCTAINSTRMDCTFTLPTSPLAPPSQRYNVVVTNPDGKQGMRANYFYVYSAAPTITSSTPSTGLQGATITITNLRGNYFQSGATVVYHNGTSIIPMTGVTVRNATSITGTLTIPAGATVGYYNITVTNPDGRTVTRANAFRVLDNAPTVTGLTNRTGYLGSFVIENITGTNFVSGATARFNGTGLDDIPATSCSDVSSTRLQCTFDLSGKTVSATNGYNIVVTNPGGKEGMRAAYFTLATRIPTVTGLTNRTGYRGWPVIESITGTNFVSGATARFNGTGLADLLPESCTYVSTTRLICTFDLAGKDPSATNGYNIVVTNPPEAGGVEGMRASYFTLSSPAPTISSSTPSSGIAGTTVAISNLRGNYFQPGATVTYWRGAYPLTFTVDDIPLRTQIVGTLTINGVAPLGYYNITVLNPDGQSVTRTNAFRVWGVPAPTISGILPGTGARGAAVPVTVTGTDIVAGARVRLYNGTTSVYTAPVGTVTATQISTTFTVGATVLPGTMNVRITNPDGQYAILTGAYELT
jgi:hypothetical protein